MKKTIFSWKKSIISVALALCLVFSSVCPAAVVWAEGEETEAPHVIFTGADGRVTSVCEGETINVNELEEGAFSMPGYGQEDVKWSCSEVIVDGKESSKHNIIQAYTGEFQGSGGQGPYTAYVSEAATGRRLLTFTLVTTPTDLEEIRLYVDGQEAPVGQVFEGLGSAVHYLTAKGRVAGETGFKDIPNRVLTIDVDPTKFSDSFDRVTWSFAVPGDNTVNYQVSVTDAPHVTASVMAGSVHVPVTGISVRVPETWEIHAWNGIFGDYYVGINAGDEKDHYSVSIEPWDASNKEVVWEALTPDIAEFMTLHGNGIVPKKQGLAKFRVHSAENADIYQDVEVNFVYKNPLKSAVIDEAITMEEGSSMELPLQVTPVHASEQRFIWTYSQDGIVTVSDTVSNDPSSVLIEKTTTHTLSAKKTGTVTVTGTPLDTTAGCEPVVFDVTVVEKTVVEPVVDALTAARNGIAKGVSWLNTASVNKYGNEWNIITLLRSGDFITAQDKAAYLESVAAQAPKLSNPTDLARVILAVGALNEDPADIGGVNLVEKLYSFDKMASQLSNGPVWALIALDSRAYPIPADAVCSREYLISQILSYVCTDGGFGLYGNTSSSLDMTGMALTALAPYNTGEHPEVQSAVQGALGYLSGRMTDQCGFVEGGSENSCTGAQVLTALSALGIDTEKDERFSRGSRNIVTNLMTFAGSAGGFKLYASDKDSAVNGMATYQTTYALAAYKRFRCGEPGLYDFSDAGLDTAFRVSRSEVTINVGEQIVLSPLNYPDPDASRFAFWWDTKDTKVVALYSGYMSINQTVYGRAVGDATITVTYNGYDPATDRDILLKATCVVHVVDPSAEPEPDDTEKTAVVSVEKFTLGQRYLIEPVEVTYPGSWNAARVLDKVLKEQGYSYENTGDLNSGFYLSSICDADDGGLEIPDCISHMTDRQGNLIPNLPTSEKNTGNDDLPNLGEFDYYGQSGWMYSVNDVFPDVGFAEKYLEDGDVMRVQFTLVGLGADLGASSADSNVQPLSVGDKTALTVDMARINGDMSGWYGSVGSSDRYEYGMKILTKVDATQEEIELARRVLKGQAAVPDDEPAKREGSCGADLTWKLDDGGVLTIEGTGALSWPAGKDVPWSSLRKEIRKVILPAGLEKIQDLAFRDCFNLAEIVNNSNLLIEAGSPHHGYVAFYAQKVVDRDGKEIGKSENRTLDAVAEHLLQGIEGNDALTDVEKALLVHDRLLNWCEFAYADTNLNAKRYETNTAYGALVEQWAVCEGYAQAYMVMMNRLGIATTVCESPALGHVWNIVTINGVQYHVDCTWDDGMLGKVGHQNLLLSSDGMAATGHTKSDWNTAPSDKRFEDYIWREATSSFELYHGSIYYVDKDGYICSWKNNFARRLTQIPDFSSVTGLGANDDGLYVSNGRSIYRYVPENSSLKLLYNLDTAGAWAGSSIAGLQIYGFKLEQNMFYLAIGASAEAAATDQGLVKLSYDIIKDGAEEPETRELTIVKQPENYIGEIGETATFSVEAEGTDLVYQWYYSKNGIKWSRSTLSRAKTNSISLKIAEVNRGNIYKCVVTDADGISVESEVAALIVTAKAVITKNPETVAAAKGDKVSFSVEADNAVSYQWYYSKDGIKWAKSTLSAATTPVLSFKVSDTNAMNIYRCQVTGADKGTVTSETAGIELKRAAVITEQPISVEAEMGSKVTFSVATENAVSYQWYYSKDGVKWSKSTLSTATTSSISFKTSAVNAANRYRCKITGEDGKEIYTDIVGIVV